MREIKFRAWDKERRVMQGDAEAIPDDSYANGFEDVVCLNSVIQLAQEQNQVLMQYTGLKDKNGKEIYEGDIVKYTYEGGDGIWRAGRKELMTGIIEWSSTGFKYEPLTGMRFVSWLVSMPGMSEGNNLGICEVIGNIYENPELLN